MYYVKELYIYIYCNSILVKVFLSIREFICLRELMGCKLCLFFISEQSEQYNILVLLFYFLFLRVFNEKLFK